MQEDHNQSSSKAVMLVIVAIIVLLTVAILLKLVRHRKNVNYQTNSAVTQVMSVTPLPTPTQQAVTTDNSDTQLNQDIKDIQSSLNKLDSDVTNVNQGSVNQSADTPQQ